MKWTDAAEAIAAMGTLVVTIIGFVLIIRQIRLVRRSLLTQANAVLSEQSLTILDFVAAHPATYDYIYRNKALQSGDPHEVAVRCACEMIANYCDLTVAMLPDLPPAVAERWTRFITDTASCCPTLREHFAEHRLWYSDDLLRLL